MRDGEHVFRMEEVIARVESSGDIPSVGRCRIRLEEGDGLGGGLRKGG